MGVDVVNRLVGSGVVWKKWYEENSEGFMFGGEVSR